MIDDQERHEIYQRCFVCGIDMDVWSPAVLSRCTPCFRLKREASYKAQTIPWEEWGTNDQ